MDNMDMRISELLNASRVEATKYTKESDGSFKFTFRGNDYDIAGEIEVMDFQNAVRHYQECLSSYGVTKTNELPKGVYEKEIYPNLW